ncbi:hsp70-binding protein [Anaeramoeba flamelloides]|uniref:Hsp70-binding protein n=1 Tax=Anaeramoeba flamelloides TaxID=1746091 RepID=A0AAV7YQ24_9EUKA|nr:hsp70-binding protein [Anaeramoeba flamelloides]KAJ6241047.1 hsp70-binding protein [Anaeramoeba flamelloides]
MDNKLLNFMISKSDPKEFEKLKDKKDDPEFQKRIKEIREVFDSLYVDETDLMRKNLTFLKEEKTDLDPEKIETALEQLTDLVERIDNANDFDKLDGITIVLEYFDHKSSKIRSGAIGVIRACCQNNPKFQKLLLEKFPDTLERYVEMLQQEEETDQVKSKLISAISSYILHFPLLQNQFFEMKGLRKLFNLLKKSNAMMQSKILFFFISLLLDINAKKLQNDFWKMKGVFDYIYKLFCQEIIKEEKNEELIDKSLTFFYLVSKGNKRNCNKFKKLGIKKKLAYISRIDLFEGIKSTAKDFNKIL